MQTTKLYDIIICQESISKKNGFEFQNLFMVLEYADTDLRKILNRVPESMSLSMDHVVHIFYNILCAINLIHSSGVMHRDIKPANILLN